MINSLTKSLTIFLFLALSFGCTEESDESEKIPTELTYFGSWEYTIRAPFSEFNDVYLMEVTQDRKLDIAISKVPEGCQSGWLYVLDESGSEVIEGVHGYVGGDIDSYYTKGTYRLVVSNFDGCIGDYELTTTSDVPLTFLPSRNTATLDAKFNSDLGSSSYILSIRNVHFDFDVLEEGVVEFLVPDANLRFYLEDSFGNKVDACCADGYFRERLSSGSYRIIISGESPVGYSSGVTGNFTVYIKGVDNFRERETSYYKYEGTYVNSGSPSLTTSNAADIIPFTIDQNDYVSITALADISYSGTVSRNLSIKVFDNNDNVVCEDWRYGNSVGVGCTLQAGNYRVVTGSDDSLMNANYGVHFSYWRTTSLTFP